jgi:hypothetical protein
LAKLTSDQIEFLRSQGIEPDDLFDASGMTPRQRKLEMEAQGKRFYFGGALCEAAGHTLRVKAGHCIQCNTQMIAYGTRFSKPSRLYVAGSLRGRCMKIGLAGSPEDRLIRMRSESYGGFDDWKVLATTALVNNAGRLEAEAQASLARYRKQARYMKGRLSHDSRELFSCNFAVAATAVAEALPSSNLFELRCTLDEAKRYEWF